MSNPYQTPQSSGFPTSRFGLAGQVPVVAILLVIQGALEVVMTILFAVFGGVMVFIPPLAPPQDQPPLPVSFNVMMAGVYLVLALVLFPISALKIWAGLKNYHYRRRGWGIAAVCSGFASVMGCYCGLTGIPLAIYGLVVYLNARSEQAFALGEQGYTREQIRDALS